MSKTTDYGGDKVSNYNSLRFEKPQLLIVGLKPSGLFKVFVCLIFALSSIVGLKEDNKDCYSTINEPLYIPMEQVKSI